VVDPSAALSAAFNWQARRREYDAAQAMLEIAARTLHDAEAAFHRELDRFRSAVAFEAPAQPAPQQLQIPPTMPPGSPVLPAPAATPNGSNGSPR
jgi:hypothetical protein